MKPDSDGQGGKSARLEYSDTCAVMGFPHDLPLTMWTGCVAGFNKPTARPTHGWRFLTSDA